MESYLYGLLGGVMIGTAAILLMMSIGRIAGISGLFFDSLKSPRSNVWALLFVAGLILGTGMVQMFSSTPTPTLSASL
ncbi:MAG: YeeE/YedE family protein, partial [Pseudomonadales bacterium]|nr:YeeE/YedE family protein [Pseudomonadales bacterium]